MLLSIGPLGTNFSETVARIQNFSFTKMHLKIPSAKWWPFCRWGDDFIWWPFLFSVHKQPTQYLSRKPPTMEQNLPDISPKLKSSSNLFDHNTYFSYYILLKFYIENGSMKAVWKPYHEQSYRRISQLWKKLWATKIFARFWFNSLQSLMNISSKWHFSACQREHPNLERLWAWLLRHRPDVSIGNK